MSTVPRDTPSEMRSRCAVPERYASPNPSVLAIPLSSGVCLPSDRHTGRQEKESPWHGRESNGGPAEEQALS